MAGVQRAVPEPGREAEGPLRWDRAHPLSELRLQMVLKAASLPFATDLDTVTREGPTVPGPHQDGGMGAPPLDLSAEDAEDRQGLQALFPKAPRIQDPGGPGEAREGEERLHDRPRGGTPGGRRSRPKDGCLRGYGSSSGADRAPTLGVSDGPDGARAQCRETGWAATRSGSTTTAVPYAKTSVMVPIISEVSNPTTPPRSLPDCGHDRRGVGWPGAAPAPRAGCTA